MANKKILILIATLFISACGSEHLDQDIPLPDAGSGSVSGGGGYNPGPDGSTTGGSGAKSGERYTTTSGGAFYATKELSLSLSYSEFFSGAANDGSTVYFATRQYLVSGTQWRIYYLNSGATSPSLHCTWIQYGSSMDGLAMDSSYFYFAESYSFNGIKRFYRSGCGSATNVSLSQTPYSANPFVVKDNKFYFGGALGGGVYGPQYLLEVPLGSGAATSLFPETIFGSYTTSWSTLKGLAIGDSYKWAIFSHDYQSYALWKFSQSGALSVGKLPSQVLGKYLYYPSELLLVSENQLVLVISGSSVTLIFLDVEGF